MNDKKIEYDIADAVMGRPNAFSVDGHQFCLYPVTLGKMYLLQRQVEALQVNQQALAADPSLETLRLVREKRDICVNVVTYHTCKDKEEVFNAAETAKRRALFAENLTDEELATLMVLALTGDKTALYMKHLGIDKEQERMRAVMKVKRKSDKNSVDFGGLSVFGTLIDAACERYGWTKDYVVWDIDYASLQLMLADKVSTVFLSEDERKKVPASALTSSSESVKATKENMERIKAMGWK